MKMYLDVSIISSNYNNGSYLIQFIDSILNNTALPKEIIIVDDGSVDNSVEILNTYSGLSILKVIILEKNVGFGNALNIAKNAASCKYCLRIDPDDILDRKRIEEQYNYMENHPEIDVLGSNARYFLDSITVLLNRTNFVSGHNLIFNRYLKGQHGVLHGTVMIRSNLYKKFDYIQENVPAEDYDLFSRMIVSGCKFDNLIKELTYVRIHSNSISNFLPYTTIKKTFNIRDQIFKKDTSKFFVWLNYYHLFYYRRFLFTNGILKRYMFLLIAILLAPQKIIYRLFKINK